MIKIENVDVWGFDHAIRGMRNPMNSWDKGDSYFRSETSWGIGKNDLDLMRRLYKAGTEHRKYLRQIFVSLDITAPLYWWKEFDTYKVGTVANSCSTMHKIAAKEFELDDFSHEHLTPEGGLSFLRNTISGLNVYRLRYIESKDKKRCKFYEYYSHEKWGDSRHYNLCIDTAKIGIDGAVDLVVSYLERYGQRDIMPDKR